MLEAFSLLAGALAAWCLLGPEYREVWDFRLRDWTNKSLDADPMASSRGRIVRATEGVSHPLWVEIRGELWKAVSTGAEPAVGSEVEILSFSGLVARVEPARGPVSSPTVEMPSRLSGERKLGLALWVICSAIAWPAFGSALYGLLGVPVAAALALVPFFAIAVF